MLLEDDEETTRLIDLNSLEEIFLFLHAKTSFNNLKKVYRLFVSLPFTSVLCESLFSHMNHIKNEYRSCLLPKNLENLLFLCIYIAISSSIMLHFLINLSKLGNNSYLYRIFIICI